MQKIPITPSGYERFQEELRNLKSVERPRIIKAIAEARAHGDLSENAEYHAAKELQGHNEARISELEDKLGRAEVIDTTSLSSEKVIFGAHIKLIDDATEQEVNYRIVGELEASVNEGSISINSPIARAMIGKEVGEVVEVTTPGGTRVFEIMEISF